MPYLCRLQANTVNTLALYPTTSRGFLYDPTLVEFRVVNMTGAVVVQDWTDVTVSGREDFGVYYAPFTPAVDATVGTHRIDWRWTDSEDEDVTRSWSLKFDVYTAGFEIGYWTYITPNAIRAEGVTTTTLPDLRLIELIERAQQLIERECRQPFRPIRHTVQFDGSGGQLWLAPMPILGVEHLRINRSTLDMDSDDFEVYSSPHLGTPGWLPKDCRRNPRVKLGRALVTSPFRAGSLLGRSGANGRFLPGAKAHELKAVWGFLEPDGTTPRLIADAAQRVVLATSTLMEAGDSSSTAGPIVREKTDNHEIEYSASSGGSSFTSLATSPEVQDILRRYRAPTAIAAPATTWASLAR